MSIQVKGDAKPKANVFKLATVKSASYDPCKHRTNYELIVNQYEVHMKEFTKTRKDIEAGRIAPGTEIIIKCNSSGLLSFVL